MTDNPKRLLAVASSVALQFRPPLTALALHNGAGKYGPMNWREQPIDATTYIDAMRRHLDDWADGEDEAPDGTHHPAHVMTTAAIVIDAWLTDALIDDRHKIDPDARARIASYVGEKGKVDGIVADFHAAKAA